MSTFHLVSLFFTFIFYHATSNSIRCGRSNIADTSNTIPTVDCSDLPLCDLKCSDLFNLPNAKLNCRNYTIKTTIPEEALDVFTNNCIFHLHNPSSDPLMSFIQNKVSGSSENEIEIRKELTFLVRVWREKQYCDKIIQGKEELERRLADINSQMNDPERTKRLAYLKENCYYKFKNLNSKLYQLWVTSKDMKCDCKEVLGQFYSLHPRSLENLENSCKSLYSSTKCGVDEVTVISSSSSPTTSSLNRKGGKNKVVRKLEIILSCISRDVQCSSNKTCNSNGEEDKFCEKILKDLEKDNKDCEKKRNEDCLKHEVNLELSKIQRKKNNGNATDKKKERNTLHVGKMEECYNCKRARELFDVWKSKSQLEQSIMEAPNSIEVIVEKIKRTRIFLKQLYSTEIEMKYEELKEVSEGSLKHLILNNEILQLESKLKKELELLDKKESEYRKKISEGKLVESDKVNDELTKVINGNSNIQPEKPTPKN